MRRGDAVGNFRLIESTKTSISVGGRLHSAGL
jgi:hypothetical protein